jgi:2,3-diaminopropionate biosynthesis protein SbnA
MATPLLDIALQVNSKWRRVSLKLESYNLADSIKYRTAQGVVEDLERADRLRPGIKLIESTSGNLGVALALLSREYDYRFTAVTDPKTDPTVLDRIRSLGANVVCVTEPDTTGGYLLSRLATVRDFLAAQPDAVWPNQYENPSNPNVHYRQTAPEILKQCPEMDAVFVAASTGGTLAGIGRYLKATAPSVKVVGVDMHGSAVFGFPNGRRLLTGIGSSRPSAFLQPGDYDDIVLVDDVAAIATCHRLQNELGLGLGGSSGAAIAACSRYLAVNENITRAVCICPDGASNYLNSLYSHEWLASNGLDLESDAAAGLFDDVKVVLDPGNYWVPLRGRIK